MELVSVIIPTFNRFNFLLNALKSVEEQNYSNIEIIIVNDGSTQKEYYEYEFGKNVILINLKNNTKEIFGYPCVGYVINQGLKIAKGKYIAFLDDDDSWLPNKLNLQINIMKKYNIKMSCTEGYVGNGIFNINQNYQKYFSDNYYKSISWRLGIKQARRLKNRQIFIFNQKVLENANIIVPSSLIFEKNLIDLAGYQLEIKMGGDENNVHIDYEYSLRLMNHTNCLYLNIPLFFYNSGHGNGQLWK